MGLRIQNASAVRSDEPSQQPLILHRLNSTENIQQIPYTPNVQSDDQQNVLRWQSKHIEISMRCARPPNIFVLKRPWLFFRTTYDIC